MLVKGGEALGKGGRGSGRGEKHAFLNLPFLIILKAW